MRPHHWVLAVVAVVAALALLFATRSASAQPAPDAHRGRALYELRCGGCHTESVHGRARRVAADYESIRGWVDRWRQSLSLDWTREDVEDVTVYLNATYYRFPCPAKSCAVISLMRVK
ncbi:MAG TPA: hypothetical protein VIR81_09575 [Myxococcales bacterium]